MVIYGIIKLLKELFTAQPYWKSFIFAFLEFLPDSRVLLIEVSISHTNVLKKYPLQTICRVTNSISNEPKIVRYKISLFILITFLRNISYVCASVN